MDQSAIVRLNKNAADQEVTATSGAIVRKKLEVRLRDGQSQDQLTNTNDVGSAGDNQERRLE